MKNRTNNNSVDKVLAEVKVFAQENNISNKEMAQILNIPYNTLRAWFYPNAKTMPSTKYFMKMKTFLNTQKESQIDDLWANIIEWWKDQHQFKSMKELSEKIGWTEEELARYFNTMKTPPKLVIDKIAELIGLETPIKSLNREEVIKRIEKVKFLLILLEDELEWFRDGPEEIRDVLREELDFTDIGYISSLMTMLSDENKFKRWLTLTTNRFNYFKKRGSGRT